MLRYIFFLAFGYIIVKLLRLFIDPMFDGKSKVASHPQATPKPQEKKSSLGDYVEYEEVK
ncbi:MAG: hypothetical protein IPI46_14630 [Bacteroidetes bacterium]|nr:hypothetical protein [Bacteroidota bacterium]